MDGDGLPVDGPAATTPRGPAPQELRGPEVEVTHEALIRRWPRLRGWLDDDIDGQRIFRHLAGAADAWDGMDRPDSELYRGARLSRTLEWRERAAPDLNDTEAAFIAASARLGRPRGPAGRTDAPRQRHADRDRR